MSKKGRDMIVVLDMSPMLRGETQKITFDYMLCPIPQDRIEYLGDAHIVGEVVDSAGYMRLCAHATLEFVAECDRCLEPVRSEFVLDFERTVANEGVLSDEQLEDNIDEYVIIENSKLDIDEQIGEALLLDFPRKILCSETCPGLCPKCGRLLKYGDCACPKKEIDPRWAALADLKLDD